jgi:serine protease AprX
MFDVNLHDIRTAIRRSMTIALVMLFALTAFGRNAKLAREFDGMSGNKELDVIVQYKTAPKAAHLAAAKALGATVKRQHSHIRAVSYHMKRNQLEKLLANDPNVTFISPNRKVISLNDYTAVTVGADIARSFGYEGAGVGVAVIDTGIAPHQDLTDNGTTRIVYNESFVTGVPDATDEDGHGTHVAGIVGGNGNASSCVDCTGTIRGIAPKVNLINLRVLDANGGGDDSATIAAVDRAIELKDQYNIRVINMSLGRPIADSYVNDPLCQAVEQAWKAGIVVVVSAGNNGRTDNGNKGYATITAPGNDPYVITVGAMKSQETDTRSDDTIATYSSKGPSYVDHVVKPDIVAPGNRVESLLAPGSTLSKQMPAGVVPTSEYTADPTAQPAYFRMSGTSMAAPVVSGAAALLLEQNPSLTPDQVKACLMESATKTFPSSSTVTDPATGVTYVSDYDVFTIGAGYLDIQAALNDTNTVPAVVGNAMSPTATQDATTGAVTLSTVPGSVWDASTTQAVWGQNGVSAEGIIWGSLNGASGSLSSEGIIWGSLSSEGIIWGSLSSEGIIWGSLSSEGIIWGSLNGALLGE